MSTSKLEKLLMIDFLSSTVLRGTSRDNISVLANDTLQ